MFFVFCNTIATHAHTGHTGFKFTKSFPAAFTWSLSVVETPLRKCEQDSSYQSRNHSNFIKAFFALLGEVPTDQTHL